jgi:hypothetical protein
MKNILDTSGITYQDGIEMYVFAGLTHQGERWDPITTDNLSRDEVLYVIFNIMSEGRTVMFIRREEGGVLYSADTRGADRVKY